RGNHDYWWSAIGKVRAALPPGMYAVQNDAIAFPGFVVCGTRGWLLPDADTSPEDEKVFRREVMRLEMTLKAGRAMAGDGRLICMMHYPPLTQTSRETPFMDVLRAYMPDDVVYGHLHGGALSGAVRGTVDGMRFHQVSCDGLGFKMYRLPD
ncbi:MAG: phosphohydrolase, partial [Clostridia bacterium]|nr:phosphohydrolase [Clostridia bacterium]